MTTLARSTPAIVVEFDESSFAEAAHSRPDILAQLDAFEDTAFGFATDPLDLALRPRGHLATTRSIVEPPDPEDASGTRAS